MGRVNFDKSIHDRKGITNKVEVVSGEQVKELKGWEVYNLPPFYEFVSQKNYQAGKPVDGPAYYKATFRLDKTGDTFLDMQTWGKWYGLGKRTCYGTFLGNRSAADFVYAGLLVKRRRQ